MPKEGYSSTKVSSRSRLTSSRELTWNRCWIIWDWCIESFLPVGEKLIKDFVCKIAYNSRQKLLLGIGDGDGGGEVEIPRHIRLEVGRRHLFPRRIEVVLKNYMHGDGQPVAGSHLARDTGGGVVIPGYPSVDLPVGIGGPDLAQTRSLVVDLLPQRIVQL